MPSYNVYISYSCGYKLYMNSTLEHSLLYLGIGFWDIAFASFGPNLHPSISWNLYNSHPVLCLH